MEQYLPDRDRRRSVCSTCHLARGVPRAITLSGGSKVIELRCPSCGVTWRMESVAAPLALPLVAPLSPRVAPHEA